MLSLQRTGIALLAGFALSATSVFAKPSADEALFARIDAMAQEAVAHKQTAGVAIAIARNGKLIYSRGFGSANLEWQRPVMPDTVFRIGSISKQFTAAAVVQLADHGLIRYDDPISKYFPAFPQGDKVTVRELLQHTSGIVNYTSSKDFDAKEGRYTHTTEEMVRFIGQQQPLYDFDAGTKWNYSNSGYYLLGALVEQVSKQSLRNYLHEHIFAPLGMAQTEFDDEADVVPNRASGYVADAKAPAGFRNASYTSMTVPGGAGSIRSTVKDLLRWHEALFAGKVTSAAGLKEMTTPGRVADGRVAIQAAFSSNPKRPPPPFSGYGFGLGLGEDHGHAWIGHGGSINGFNADLKTYPQDQLSLVLLTNTDGAARPIGNKLTAILFGEKSASAH